MPFLEKYIKRRAKLQILGPSVPEGKGIPREKGLFQTKPNLGRFPKKRVISGRKNPSPVSKICIKELVGLLTSCRIWPRDNKQIVS